MAEGGPRGGRRPDRPALPAAGRRGDLQRHDPRRAWAASGVGRGRARGLPARRRPVGVSGPLRGGTDALGAAGALPGNGLLGRQGRDDDHPADRARRAAVRTLRVPDRDGEPEPPPLAGHGAAPGARTESDDGRMGRRRRRTGRRGALRRHRHAPVRDRRRGAGSRAARRDPEAARCRRIRRVGCAPPPFDAGPRLHRAGDRAGPLRAAERPHARPRRRRRNRDAPRREDRARRNGPRRRRRGRARRGRGPRGRRAGRVPRRRRVRLERGRAARGSRERGPRITRRMERDGLGAGRHPHGRLRRARGVEACRFRARRRPGHGPLLPEAPAPGRSVRLERGRLRRARRPVPARSAARRGTALDRRHARHARPRRRVPLPRPGDGRGPPAGARGSRDRGGRRAGPRRLAARAGARAPRGFPALQQRPAGHGPPRHRAASGLAGSTGAAVHALEDRRAASSSISCSPGPRTSRPGATPCASRRSSRAARARTSGSASSTTVTSRARRCPSSPRPAFRRPTSAFRSSRRVGYVRGAADRVPEALMGVRLPVEILTARQLGSADLSGFDAILVGSRAYETDPALPRANGRLLDYVRERRAAHRPVPAVPVHPGRLRAVSRSRSRGRTTGSPTRPRA